MKTVTLYVHSDKESSYLACLEAGLSEKAAQLGRYLGYEVELTYEVDDHGNGTLVKVNGKWLEE